MVGASKEETVRVFAVTTLAQRPRMLGSVGIAAVVNIWPWWSRPTRSDWKRVTGRAWAQRWPGRDRDRVAEAVVQQAVVDTRQQLRERRTGRLDIQRSQAVRASVGEGRDPQRLRRSDGQSLERPDIAAAGLLPRQHLTERAPWAPNAGT